MWEVENVSITSKKKIWIKSFSMTLQKGESMAVIGPKESGKTLLLHTIAGRIRPNCGTMRLDGIDADKHMDQYKKKFGLVPYGCMLPEQLKTMEYLKIQAKMAGMNGRNARKKCYEILEWIGMLSKEKQYISSLNYGERQKLCVSAALLIEPSYILFDEPENRKEEGNAYGLNELIKKIRNQRIGVVVTASDFHSEIFQCEKVTILNKGEAFMQGDMGEIISMQKKNHPILIEVLEHMETAIEILKTNDRVEKMIQDGNRIIVFFQGDKIKEAKLLQTLIRSHVHVSSFARETEQMQGILENSTAKKKGEEHESDF